MNIRKLTGLSLVELCCSLATVTTLSSMATPQFSDLINRHRVTTTTEHLRSSMAMARQAAISSKHDVYICALKNIESCDKNRPFNANWSGGWLVFIDLNDNGQLDDTDDVIKTQSQQTKTGIIFNQRGRLRFKQNGSARSAGFYICNKSTARHILILYSGRTRVKVLDNLEKMSLCENAASNTDKT